MDQSDIDQGWEFRGKSESKVNWRLVRKIETLVFASLIIAIPIFSLRIFDAARTALLVQNSALDLVNSLMRSRAMAKDFRLTITVASTGKDLTRPNGYLIRNGMRIIEPVDFPNGVALIGSVTFDENGLPTSPASFIISKGNKSVSVDVNAKGEISTH